MTTSYNTIYKVIIVVVIMAVTFAAGRYSVSAPTVKTDIQKNTETQKDTNTNKVITITKDPSGKEVTTITENTTTTTNRDTQTHLDQTVTPPQKNTLNISALAGVDPLNSFKPTYGASVTKSILGPITVGAYGLTNGIFGLSIGLNF